MFLPPGMPVAQAAGIAQPDHKTPLMQKGVAAPSRKTTKD
jgi:hypothetical protein